MLKFFVVSGASAVVPVSTKKSMFSLGLCFLKLTGSSQVNGRKPDLVATLHLDYLHVLKAFHFDGSFPKSDLSISGHYSEEVFHM